MSARIRRPVPPAIRLEATTDEATWDRLADSLSEQPDYHRWRWLNLHAEMRGIVVERLLIMQGATPVGIFPLPRHSTHALTGVVLPFPYVGPLVPAALLPEAVAALRTWQRRNGLVLARFELTPEADPSASRRLASMSCRVVENHTVTVDLSHGSLTTMRARYSSGRRNDIKRAQRRGVVVRPAAPQEVRTLLPAVLDDVFSARDRHSPYPASIGAALEAYMRGREDIVAFVVTVDGEPAGIHVVLANGPVAMVWLGGCFRRHFGTNAGAVLYDHVLGWAVGAGHRAVDLCGEVDPHVLQFKLRFGGHALPYTAAESSVLPLPMVRAASAVRHRLRRPRG